MGFLSSVNEFVSKLDNFAYIPTFYIKQKPSYQSTVGGYFYITYLCFFLAYVLYSLSNFFQQYNQINSVKLNLAGSNERKINISDIQFGLGLIDNDDKNLDWNDFPQLEIIVNSYINNQKAKTFNLSYCQQEYIYAPEDWDELSQQDQITTNNLLNNYYKCPDNNTFGALLTHKNSFFSNISYFEIIVKIKNLSMLDSAINLIQSKRPTIQLIWGSFAFEYNNFSNPISTFIDSNRFYLRNNTVSNSEIFLDPLILYDNQIFGNSLSPYKSIININQADGALFTVGEGNIFDEDIADRSQSKKNDENLFLKRYKFKLGFQMREITRYRTIFLTFLTTLTSVPSLVLFIFIVIMERVNLMLAKNHLFKGLFSLNYFKNISNFRSEYMRRFSV